MVFYARSIPLYTLMCCSNIRRVLLCRFFLPTHGHMLLKILLVGFTERTILPGKKYRLSNLEINRSANLKRER